jgi:hypothetical protein
MKDLTYFIHEVYKAAYLQGREDGLEGLYIEPKLVLDHFIIDQNIATKLSQLAFLSSPNPGEKAADLH